MNHPLFLVLFIALGLSSCTNDEPLMEGINFRWTLIEYTNIAGQAHCQYDEGDVIWQFEDDKLKINGRLVTPWAFTPCFEVDSTYTAEFTFVIIESNNEDIIYIEDLDLRAKISTEDELILEIISSSEFKPSTEGVKVFFEKI